MLRSISKWICTIIYSNTDSNFGRFVNDNVPCHEWKGTATTQFMRQRKRNKLREEVKEELKRELKEILKQELKEEVKRELKDELVKDIYLDLSTYRRILDLEYNRLRDEKMALLKDKDEEEAFKEAINKFAKDNGELWYLKRGTINQDESSHEEVSSPNGCNQQAGKANNNKKKRRKKRKQTQGSKQLQRKHGKNPSKSGIGQSTKREPIIETSAEIQSEDET